MQYVVGLFLLAGSVGFLWHLARTDRLMAGALFSARLERWVPAPLCLLVWVVVWLLFGLPVPVPGPSVSEQFATPLTVAMLAGPVLCVIVLLLVVAVRRYEVWRATGILRGAGLPWPGYHLPPFLAGTVALLLIFAIEVGAGYGLWSIVSPALDPVLLEQQMRPTPGGETLYIAVVRAMTVFAMVSGLLPVAGFFLFAGVGWYRGHRDTELFAIALSRAARDASDAQQDAIVEAAALLDVPVSAHIVRPSAAEVDGG